MHNLSSSRSFRIVAILLFLCLLVLGLGTGMVRTAASQKPGTPPAPDGVSANTSSEGVTPRETNPADLPTPSPARSRTIVPSGPYQASSITTPASTTASLPTPEGEFVPAVVMVGVDPALTANEIAQCLKSANVTLKAQIKEIDALQVSVLPGREAEAIASLSGCPGVSYAQPDYIVQMSDTIPDDPLFINQYGLLAIHAPQGWDLNTGSSTVTIAIVDSGVDLGHPDLAGKLVSGIDIVNGDTIPQDDTNNSHGTHVAGIAAALTDNAIGVAGVSWGARIMPVKVLNAFGGGSTSNVALGIIWAADHNADVINLSLGCPAQACPNPPAALGAAIDYAYGKGVTLVAAAGNDGTNFVDYPARFPHVIAVAATDQSNNQWTSSNFGPEVDVSAPGVGIYSTYRGNIYGYLTGTSMSTSFVSGLAAILRGLPNYSSPDQIAGIIDSTALDIGDPGKDDLYGFGLIQMDAAIQSFQALPTPTPTSSPTLIPSPTPTVTRLARTPVSTPAAAILLPATGFNPGQKTILPEQPLNKAYPYLDDLWLEIPTLGLNIPIVGVPLIDNKWDVSWLGDQAGWLNGTAFPTHAGNSVISAHVYDASGNPGPFVNLGTLVWGDQIFIHAFAQEYEYSVQDVLQVVPGAISTVLRHEEYPWLTLITCQGYDETSGSYRTRVVVRAVQVAIR